MIGLAAPASADGNDTAFLSALNGAGLTHSGSDRAVAAGHAVCQLMDSGLSAVDTVSAVRTTNPGFSVENATVFANISASAYCPQHI